MKINPKRLQAGFTIVELLVSLIIGLVLIGGVTQIYMLNKENLNAQQDLQSVHEDLSIITRQLTQVIRHAGYSSTPEDNDFTDVFTPVAPYIRGAGLASDVQDQIEIRYQDAGSLIDCVGNTGHGAPGAPVIVTTTYRINSDAQLLCSVDGGAPVVVAEGVEALVFRYGEDLDSDGAVNGWLRAGDVSNWMNVRAVQFALVMAGGEAAKLSSTAEQFDLLGIAWTSAADTQLRRIAERAVFLPARPREI